MASGMMSTEEVAKVVGMGKPGEAEEHQGTSRIGSGELVEI
jgi:hypothetical protein